jgi:hypothetical protein
MIGRLIATFCERPRAGTPHALELWAFPDGTLNLVLSEEGVASTGEHAFPCFSEHLEWALDGREVKLRNAADECVRLMGRGDKLIVQYCGQDDSWLHQLEKSALHEALLAVQI